MGGGLKQKTTDYKYVMEKFLSRAYDTECYDADEIWKDPEMCFYKRDYDQRHFKQSLVRMVNRINAENLMPPPCKFCNSFHMSYHVTLIECRLPALAQGGDAGAGGGGAGGGAARTPIPRASATPDPNARNPRASAPEASSAPREHVVNDEIPMATPYHMFAWKDSNHAAHLTCMVLLPVGATKYLVVPRIATGGDTIFYTGE
jgi:hypothetical protein